MEMMKPMRPIMMGPVICQNFSPLLSECHALNKETMQAKTQGGELSRSVGTYE